MPDLDGPRQAAEQLRDRLLLNEWEPHSEPEFPGDEDTLRFHMFRIFDEAYDLLLEDGMESDEAVTTVRLIFGSATSRGTDDA